MILTIILLGFLLFLLVKITKKPDGLPPGDWGWPVVGVSPGRLKNLTAYIDEQRKKFGDVFMMKMGSRLIVIISDFSLIKQAFTKPELQGRPDFYTFQIFSLFENLGLVASSGRPWLNGRRFALRHLRDFGLGKSRLEGTVQREVEALIQELEKDESKPMKLEWSLNVAVLNVIWGLVANRRYEINDKEIQRFANLINDDLDIIQGPMVLLDMYPWLISIIPKLIKNKWMKTDVVEKNLDLVFNFFREVVSEHKDKLDPKNPQDYIDAYLIELEAQKDTPDSTFRQDHLDLLVSLTDLFIGGSETASSTLRWMVLYMALNPHVQQKIQDEIDSVVPKDMLPSLEHKDRLPYLEAAVYEVQRKAALIPLGVSHAATEDTTFNGYKIPKGTILMANAEGCHFNKKYFENPDEFYPDHFLDEDGKLRTKRDGFLPFSLGRRQCLGESLAKMELYLFTGGLLQKFKISPPPGVTLTTETDRTGALFNFVKPYEVVLTKRM